MKMNTLRVDLSGDDVPCFEEVDFSSIGKVAVDIPLPSFGSSNSYMDLCGDLLDASWAIDHLADCAGQVSTKIGEGHYKPNITASYDQPTHAMLERLNDCRLVFTDDPANVCEEQRLQELRSDILDHADKIDEGDVRAPEIADHYLGNLMAAYGEIMCEHPEWYAGDMKNFPERSVGYFRSAYSNQFGANLYASWDAWLVPGSVSLDTFFAALKMRYRLTDFEPSEIHIFPNGGIVHANGRLMKFPANEYFRSRICAGFAISGLDEEAYHSEVFRWSLGRSISTCRETGLLPGDGIRVEAAESIGAYVHSTEPILIVDDGRFNHLLFDGEELNRHAAKAALRAVAQLHENISVAVGGVTDLSLDWSSLSDDQFEELCYDVLDADPKYDSETIRKMGKSRSRDGGRDIVVHELRRWVADRPRKWIFQCKLVTNSSSLGSTKLLDIGDTIEQYGADGFGVMTSAPIDATLYDKLDSISEKRGVKTDSWSVYELNRALARHPTIRRRYFETS